MSLSLRRITFFVENLPAATSYYSDALGMKGTDIRNGWSAYEVSGKFEIAFHKGKGKKPRLEYITTDDLATVRERMNKNGAKLRSLEKVSENVFRCRGKDPDRNSIEIYQSNK